MCELTRLQSPSVLLRRGASARIRTKSVSKEGLWDKDKDKVYLLKGVSVSNYLWLPNCGYAIYIIYYCLAIVFFL